MLTRHQASRAGILSLNDFIIEHMQAKKTTVDGPSRRPDNEIRYGNLTVRHRAT
jgi:hypothetical protein